MSQAVDRTEASEGTAAPGEIRTQQQEGTGFARNLTAAAILVGAGSPVSTKRGRATTEQPETRLLGTTRPEWLRKTLESGLPEEGGTEITRVSFLLPKAFSSKAQIRWNTA